MSFYRNLLVAVAAMSLGTAVFADDNASTTSTTTTETTVAQPADTSMQPAATDTQAATTTTTTTTSTDKLDINTANAKQLMKIKGINSHRAHAIVKYRKKHGNFKSIEDLKEVKGFQKMSDKKFQKIEDQLTAS